MVDKKITTHLVLQATLFFLQISVFCGWFSLMTQINEVSVFMTYTTPQVQNQTHLMSVKPLAIKGH